MLSITRNRLWIIALFLQLVIATARLLADGKAELAAGFASPPPEARPLTWWRFMDDLATHEGVVTDLNAIKQLGMSGAVVSFCDSRWHAGQRQWTPGMPVVPILSDSWWELIRFQLKEASDRGLDVWYQGTPGYATSGGPWITPELSMQKLVWSEKTCEGGAEVNLELPQPAVDPKWNYYRDALVLAFPSVKDGTPVSPQQVIELTGRMDVSGRLHWNAPAGTWRVVRFGHTTTGRTTHPTPPGGEGLECDKFSKVATRVHFENYFDKILSCKPAGTTSKIELAYDSWEADVQTWSSDFRQQFQKLRGYDLLPWLPTVLGQVVGSEELTRRFDHDYRTTIQNLIDSEHVAELAKLCHQAGVRFRLQPYNGQYNFMTAGALADIPEGEYWYQNKNYGWWTLRQISSVCNISGKHIASAESLTASPEDLRFNVSPWDTKLWTDLAFAHGVNSMSHSVMPHNPWPDRKPGMVAGPYSGYVGPTQPFNEFAASWVSYLSRCCYLLQQGRTVCDVVTLYRVGQRGFTPPEGFNSDLCNEELIISSMNFDGQYLTLPSGARYRLLELVDNSEVIPWSGPATPFGKKDKPANLPQSISPQLLRKIRELVYAGATVVGPKPMIAPGLSDYPNADAEVRILADELWGDQSENKVHRRVGKGRIISGVSVDDALNQMNIQPDVNVLDAIQASEFAWIHRTLREDEIYFISSQRDMPLVANFSFRVTGKQPQFWHADTGIIEPARNWTIRNGRTEVKLELDRRESVFVVFTPGPIPALPVALERPKILETVPVAGSWKVRFNGFGTPNTLELDKLISWADFDQKEIRYFSGIGTYEKVINVPGEWLKPSAKVLLDLGELHDLARIGVNGIVITDLWKPPFQVDITNALHAGDNSIQIQVANVWANRLAGDEQEPDDVKWNDKRLNSQKRFTGQSMKEYPSWLVGTTRPSLGRYTFSTYKLAEKDQPLLAAGLLGPVQLKLSTRN